MTDILIGIDTGVNTGFAKIHDGVLQEVKSWSIIQAMESVLSNHRFANKHGLSMKLYIEDARLRKWVTGGREKLQGVGSVKRDAGIWEEFCIHHDIDFELVAPKSNKTKMKAKEFKQLTGWQPRTNEHGRDATMLIFGRGL